MHKLNLVYEEVTFIFYF